MPQPRLTALAALTLAGSLALTGCGGSDDEVAVDTGSDTGGAGNPPPSGVPAAEGPVQSRDLVTVIDDGDGEGPRVCLGAIAESYPPQCDGPPVADWTWKGLAHETVEAVKFGQFALTGTWDGQTLSVTDAIPAALYTPMVGEETTPPDALRQYPESRLREIAQEVSRIDAAQGAYVQQNHVFLDVSYDDGSIQEWADAEHGANVVIVVPVLEPVSP